MKPRSEVGLIFTYWTDDNSSEEEGVSSLSSMKSEWESEFSDFRVYDDSAVLPLLEAWGEPAKDIFRHIQIPSCRSDLARLLLLLEFGGLYVDAHTGIGNRSALSDLDKTFDSCELLLFDMPFKHKDDGDIWVPNGAMYSHPRCSIVRSFVKTAFENLERQQRLEEETGTYVPYNIAALTGAWIIVSKLFNLRTKPFRLKSEFSDVVKLWPLYGNAKDPIRLALRVVVWVIFGAFRALEACKSGS
jgi:hypothetical protein